MMWMAWIREHERNPAEAEALYKSALAAAKPDSADAANTMQLYARILQDQGRGDEAKPMEERAEVIIKALSGRFWVETGQSQPEVYRVGGGVTAPSLVYKTEPQYSEEARFAKYSGKVILSVEVATDEKAHNVQIVKGLGLGLDEQAIEAVSQWRFKPATKDGVAVRVSAHIEINFRLM